MKKEYFERVSTGITNLDPLLGGGFPKGSTVVYHGPPGAGKTICALHFLIAGLKNNETVFYITFEEGMESLMSLAKTIGMNIEKAVEDKKFIIKDLSQFFSEKSLSDSIAKKASEYNITRVVIDSLTTAIIDHISNDNSMAIKRLIRQLFGSLRHKGFTTVLISRDELEFDTAVGMSDCAIYFEPHLMGDEGLSTLKITKVRLSKHSRKLQYLDITNKGEVMIRQEK